MIFLIFIFQELIVTGYRIVSLNTVFYYHLDNTTRFMFDPAGQLAWLTQTLTQARAQGERVYIAAQ